jgi:hypothetical protein
MRRFRGLGILLLLALGVGLIPTTSAQAAGCEVKFSDQAASSTCRGELGWSYDPVSGTFGYGSVIASATDNDPYEYKTDVACDANIRSPGADIACPKAFNCPEKLDPEGKPMPAIRMVAFRRLRADPNDPWQRVDNGVCKYTAGTVPMSDVLAVAGQSIEEKVGKPSIIAQPPNGATLVNFTSLFHAPVQKVTTLQITKPVSGEITASPKYTWDLDEGFTAEGEGHPYDKQVDPSKPESDGYYVKAFYRTPGLKKVHLTLTWEVSIRLDGFGVVPLAPIVFTADTTTTAKTAHAHLVAR